MDGPCLSCYAFPPPFLYLNHSANQWFPARVTEITHKGSYTVKFEDDGRIEKGFSHRQLRLVEFTSPKKLEEKDIYSYMCCVTSCSNAARVQCENDVCLTWMMCR